MKILHTSDWHLGRTLFDQKRDHELQSFIDWLLDHMEKNPVDALLIAGDIFHTTTPTHSAQQIYYNFITSIHKRKCCNQVVIIGGNHDSPSFLSASRGILSALRVHVVAQGCEDPADEVFVLNDQSGQPGMVVCAVPFLRDSYVRKFEEGQTSRDKEKSLAEGIKAHYHQVCQEALTIMGDLPRPVPLVAMGHLYTTGGTILGDQDRTERNLYVGTAMHLDDHTFPDQIDYLALGHLHQAQQVKGHKNRMYSGAPIPMGFGEAGQDKYILEVTFPQYPEGTAPEEADFTPEIKEVQVPCFQKLLRVEGDWEEIRERIGVLKEKESSGWLEVLYTGTDIIANLHEQVINLVTGSDLIVLKVTRKRQESQPLEGEEYTPIEEMDYTTVFDHILQVSEPEKKFSEEQIKTLKKLYQEVIHQYETEDKHADHKGED